MHKVSVIVLTKVEVTVLASRELAMPLSNSWCLALQFMFSEAECSFKNVIIPVYLLLLFQTVQTTTITLYIKKYIDYSMNTLSGFI